MEKLFLCIYTCDIIIIIIIITSFITHTLLVPRS